MRPDRFGDAGRAARPGPVFLPHVRGGLRPRGHDRRNRPRPHWNVDGRSHRISSKGQSCLTSSSTHMHAPPTLSLLSTAAHSYGNPGAGLRSNWSSVGTAGRSDYESHGMARRSAMCITLCWHFMVPGRIRRWSTTGAHCSTSGLDAVALSRSRPPGPPWARSHSRCCSACSG